MDDGERGQCMTDADRIWEGHPWDWERWGFTRGGVWEGPPWELDSGFQESSPCSTRPES